MPIISLRSAMLGPPLPREGSSKLRPGGERVRGEEGDGKRILGTERKQCKRPGGIREHGLFLQQWFPNKGPQIFVGPE